MAPGCNGHPFQSPWERDPWHHTSFVRSKSQDHLSGDTKGLIASSPWSSIQIRLAILTPPAGARERFGGSDMRKMSIEIYSLHSFFQLAANCDSRILIQVFAKDGVEVGSFGPSHCVPTLPDRALVCDPIHTELVKFRHGKHK